MQGANAFAYNYRQLFAGNYEKAEHSADAVRPLLQKYAREYGEDSRMLEAVVFPEIIRYNRVYDVVETGSLLGLYSRFGAEYANFSVGMLQMKPTFAESIERQVACLRGEKWVKELGFDKLGLINNYDNRVARVNRIDDLDWQVKYLVAMVKCLKSRNAELWKHLNNEQRLMFVATAYNTGWNKPAETILSYTGKAYYHLNPFSAGTKYCFADVALYRYKELTAGV